MFEFLKNLFGGHKYSNDREAVVVSCYYNFQKSQYRLNAFLIWYETIKHLNHRIIECVMDGEVPQLPSNPNIEVIYTSSNLWHKEQLLNKIVTGLPAQFKYVFWVDADVIFSNLNWLTESVEKMKNEGVTILQPFSYCVHLKKAQKTPDFNLDEYRGEMNDPETCRNMQMWKSFAKGVAIGVGNNTNYDIHGHVGFAWGAKRSVLQAVPLYERALIGGADHIIAHAALGQIPCKCISETFAADIDEVNSWSAKFYQATKGHMGVVEGDLYHLWHGDLEKRDYYKRIKDFTGPSKVIIKRDKSGLYTTDDTGILNYMNNYMLAREVTNSMTGLFGDDYSQQTQQPDPQFQGFGGGNSGGAGAGGSWDDNTPQNQSQQITDNTQSQPVFDGPTEFGPAEVGHVEAVEAGVVVDNPSYFDPSIANDTNTNFS